MILLMRTSKWFAFHFSIFLSFNLAANAEALKNSDEAIASRPFPKVKIGPSEERLLRSQKIGKSYKLWIGFPKKYDTSKSKYPVIYVLDAQWDFPHIVSLYDYLNYDGYIPDAILVGITWDASESDIDKHRFRDFTPTLTEAFEESGGADNFIHFLQKEAIPFIEEQYHVNDDRTLIGSSLSGLFASYVMFKKPQLFNKYLITAPSYWWDDEVIYNYVEGFSQRIDESPIQVYAAVGGLDRLEPSFRKMKSLLDQQQFIGLKYKAEVLGEYGHAGVKAIGNTRGLQYLFAKQKITLSPQALFNFIGEYKDENGLKTRVSVEGGKLAVTGPDGVKDFFEPSSNNTFYKLGESLSLKFNNERQPNQLIVKPHEGEYLFLKVDD